MKIYLSPNIADDEINQPPTFEQKVRLFHDRFHGWKFLIARQMLEGYTAKDGQKIPSIPDAGYAAMDVMFSYFEPIGKYVHGYCNTDPKNPQLSRKYFKLGVRSIFPDLDKHPKQEEVDSLLTMLWEGVRCGLYHAGKTGGNIGITGDIKEPIRVDPAAKVMFINPHILVLALTGHLNAYRDALISGGQNSDLGMKFEARFDFENQ